MGTRAPAIGFTGTTVISWMGQFARSSPLDLASFPASRPPSTRPAAISAPMMTATISSFLQQTPTAARSILLASSFSERLQSSTT
ncbi:unnamed protein product [Symbiodinium pilosum]|uniref:Uncharacterized protein n=1 Tax=Symbiodinium pilosum TaxID=2952 RepID=A0A812QKD0_SYMPI|nr:unnamed protein product [Symbiodinium pilosum]